MGPLFFLVVLILNGSRTKDTLLWRPIRYAATYIKYLVLWVYNFFLENTEQARSLVNLMANAMMMQFSGPGSIMDWGVLTIVCQEEAFIVSGYVIMVKYLAVRSHINLETLLINITRHDTLDGGLPPINNSEHILGRSLGMHGSLTSGAVLIR